MLYLGIDVHRKQLTVNIRNEAGEPIVRRQVSTEWQRLRAFFEELAEHAAGENSRPRYPPAHTKSKSQSD